MNKYHTYIRNTEIQKDIENLSKKEIIKRFKDITYLIAFIKEIAISKLSHSLKGTISYKYIKNLWRY